MTDVVILGLGVTELLVLGLSVVAAASALALVRVRRRRAAWQRARAVEETVSLEDLNQRIALYVPRHVEVEAPSRAATPHFLTNSGIHTNKASAEWAASFRERAGIGGEDAPAAVTSDPDEDLAKWRDHALMLIADPLAPEPAPATLDLGWTVPAVSAIPDPVRIPEPVWTIAASRIEAVMADAPTESELTPAPASVEPSAGEPIVAEAVEPVSGPSGAEAAAALVASFFELPPPPGDGVTASPVDPRWFTAERLAALGLSDTSADIAEPVVAGRDAAPPEVAAEREDRSWTTAASGSGWPADPEIGAAEVSDIAAAEALEVGAEAAAVEIEAGRDAAAVESEASPDPAPAVDEVPELSALVRALDALRSASVPDAAYPANAAFVTAPEAQAESGTPHVAEIGAPLAAEIGAPLAAEIGAPLAAEIVTSRVPEIAQPTAAASRELSGRRGTQGRRRRMVRRRSLVRSAETRDEERSITVVAPSRARDGAEVRLRLDLDSDGLAALLQALEQGKIDDVPVQPGLVVIPGGKQTRRAN